MTPYSPTLLSVVMGPSTVEEALTLGQVASAGLAQSAASSEALVANAALLDPAALAATASATLSLAAAAVEQLVSGRFEGYGCSTYGGDAGTVLHVTTTADSGAGSLREALATAGPRRIVFDVAGTITVATPLLVTQPFCTISGQTAPAPGITIVTSAQSVPNTLWIQTHDVIVEHIAIRPLLVTGYTPGQIAWGIGVRLEGGTYNVVLDHCSISHVTERCVSTNDASDVTLSWCIFSRALGAGTGQAGYEKGKGLSTHGTSTRYSVHHCIFGDLYQRSPQVTRTADVRYTVTYDWEDFGSYAHNIVGDCQVNFVGNWIIPGPHSASVDEGLHITDWRLNTQSAPNAGSIEVYFENNDTGPGEIILTRWLDNSTLDGLTMAEAIALGIVVETPHPAPSVTPATLIEVLDGAGRMPRDATDATLMLELYIASPTQEQLGASALIAAAAISLTSRLEQLQAGATFDASASAFAARSETALSSAILYAPGAFLAWDAGTQPVLSVGGVDAADVLTISVEVL